MLCIDDDHYPFHYTLLSMNQGMLFTYTDPPIPTVMNLRILCTERTLLPAAKLTLLLWQIWTTLLPTANWPCHCKCEPKWILNDPPRTQKDPKWPSFEQQTDPPSHGKYESKDPKWPFSQQQLTLLLMASVNPRILNDPSPNSKLNPPSHGKFESKGPIWPSAQQQTDPPSFGKFES